MDALETLSSIIYDDDDDEDDDDEGDLSESMGSKELGLLPILVSIISLDGIMAREAALAILAMTSIYSSNHRYMLSLELGLVPVLASVLSSYLPNGSDYECRFHSLQILLNIHSAHDQDDCSVYDIGSKDLGVLPGLVMALDMDEKYFLFYHFYALRTLEELAKDSENILYMGSEELGLLLALKRFLFYSDDDCWDCEIAVNILHSLSDEPVNRALMGSDALGLVTVLRESTIFSKVFNVYKVQ
jgi:hypothetical protein